MNDELREEDLKIQVYRGPGVGGQVLMEPRAHCPSVSVTHIPTGIKVAVSARTQLEAKVQCIEILQGLVSGFITVDIP